MRTPLTAAAAAALIASPASPAVAAPSPEAGSAPPSNGIITDYPTRLRTVMEERGLKLPKAYAVQA